jgi:hypothetical protein
MAAPTPLRFAAVWSALALGACVQTHQVQRLPSPDRSYVLIVDYIKSPLGTQDVVVSLEEARGLATEVARINNIQTFNAGWLGPEDVGICQMGTPVAHKTHLVLNASKGPQDFYIHYACPIG